VCMCMHVYACVCACVCVCVCVCLCVRVHLRVCTTGFSFLYLFMVGCFVCLSVRLSPLEQQGADPPPSYLVPPRPAKTSHRVLCRYRYDAFTLPTTNAPRYSRFDPNRPDPNPIEDKFKERIMAVSQQALAGVPSRHHHVADCAVPKRSPQQMAPGIEPGTSCKCLQADTRPAEL